MSQNAQSLDSPRYSPRTLANINYSGLSATDVMDFCKSQSVDFCSLGSPENWDDPSVFRAATLDFPQRGVTVPLSTVAKWKEAVAQMGERISSGGRYQHYKGGFYTTVCEAVLESGAGVSLVVYRSDDGQTWARPVAEFFSVVSRDGQLLPRFKQVR